MRITCHACALAALAVVAVCPAQAEPVGPSLTPALVQHVQALQPKVGARARILIGQEAARVLAGDGFSLLQIRTDLGAADIGVQNGSDIDALVQLVLLQAAVDAETELRREVNALETDISRRKVLRGLTAAMRRNARIMRVQAGVLAQPSPMVQTPPIYSLDTPGAGVGALEDRIAADQDQLTPLTQQVQAGQFHLRVQMDRIARTQTLLSNLLKAAADMTANLASPLK